MKKICQIIMILSLSQQCLAQSDMVNLDQKIIKVKPKKTINYKPCERNELKNEAVTLEFDVLNVEDQKIFGKKLYAIIPCIDFPGEGTFDGKYEWDLKISETKFYNWEIKILNEELLDKNIGKRKFWVRDLSRMVTVNCGVKSE